MTKWYLCTIFLHHKKLFLNQSNHNIYTILLKYLKKRRIQHSWVWILCIFIWRVVCPIVQPNRIRRGEAYMRSFCATMNVAVLKIHPPQNCYALDSKQYNATLSITSTLKITKIPQTLLLLFLRQIYMFLCP